MFSANLLLNVPSWVWWLIGAVAVIAFITVVVILIIIDCANRRDEKANGGTVEEASVKREKETKPKKVTEEKVEKKQTKPAKVTEEKAEKQTKKAETKGEKPAEKKTSAQKSEQPAAKKAETKPVKETKPAEKKAETKPAQKGGKVYHISKRKDDGMWQIKAAGAEKAIKLFKTQKEAIDYCKTLAGNQDASIMIHKEDGSFRKLTY